ncbi:mediator of RNA polymerase II transcription subunit 18 isoform X1 [Sebastes umbrosus]|uniref:mediator of RNA polymerase II transcription subunit 18 isoform X1 n=1 Tax=Sebastes umbrosus TaxID=72105 RepID=UPI0018A07EB3|nr:mediator of RNA polymerase II transcription subunit 18 isoform X1 [Sebastes umbrosus]
MQPPRKQQQQRERSSTPKTSTTNIYPPASEELHFVHFSDKNNLREDGSSSCFSDACHWRHHQHDGVPAASVLDQALESLLHRLRGLCDNMEPETFTDHELVYLLKGQQGNPFILRARRSLSHPTSPWHLRYLGQPEVGDKSRHALVRNCVDVAASHSLPEFLNEMGFRMDHEFVANGHIFRKGVMKIVVSKLSRILVPGNTENTERLSLSYLVELSVLAPAGQDTMSEEVRSFAEQLKPLVHLEKIDPSKQRH